MKTSVIASTPDGLMPSELRVERSNRHTDAASVQLVNGHRQMGGHFSPGQVRQIIGALEPYAAPRKPAPQPEPPLFGVEWLTGRTPAADDGRYEVVFSYHGAPFVRSGNTSAKGLYTKAEAERRARNEQRAMGGDSGPYRYTIRSA